MNRTGKIILFQHQGIGDMIMITPMLAEIRRLLPHSEVTVVAGSTASAEIVEGSGLCDRVWIVPIGRMNIFDLVRFFKRIKYENFDLAILGNRISIRVAQLLRIFSRIKVVAGNYFPPRRWSEYIPPRRWGLTHKCMSDVSSHRVVDNINVLKTLIPEAGIPERSTVFIDDESKKGGEKFWTESSLDGCDVIGIHFGAHPGAIKKRLPIEKLNSIIRRFLDKFSKAKIMIFAGPEEKETINKDLHINSSIVVADSFPIRTVGYLISKTKVFLSTDSSLGHIAAAVGVPVVVVAGPSKAEYNRPWAEDVVIVRTKKEMQCMPCLGFKRYDKCEDVSCMKSISEDEVLKAVSNYL